MAPPQLPLTVTLGTPSLHAANAAAIALVMAAPLLSPSAVSAPCAIIREALPLLGRLLARALQAFAAGCYALRTRRAAAFMLVHGAITYACGDVLAQLATGPQGPKVLWLPLRTARAAIVGLASDTVPFFFWSTALASLGPEAPLVTRTGLSSFMRRSPSALLALKVGLHLALFQTFSTGSYLFLQAWLRGEGASSAAALLRDRFLPAYAPAFASFLVGGVLVYRLQSLVLQAALRNLGVLAIAVYLAMIASA